MTFWATVVAATKTLLADGFENGLGMFERSDSARTSSAHALPESSGSFGAGFDGSQFNQEEIVAPAGSLEADFEPGKTFHFAYEKLDGNGVGLYMGVDGTDTFADQYELVVYPKGGSGGYILYSEVGGNRTTLADTVGAWNFPAGSGEWGHVYLMWDPPAGDPRDDGDQTGDWLIEVQNEAHEPLLTEYVDIGNTDHRGGGFVFYQNASSACWWDDPEVGDPGAFTPDFDHTRHHERPGDIHSFEHADLLGFGSESDRRQFRTSKAVPTLGRDFVLVNPAGTAFSEMFSNPDGSITEQRYPLVNYPANGDESEIALRTDDLGGGKSFVYLAADGGADCVRWESRWDENRSRVLSWQNNSVSVEYDTDDDGISAPNYSADRWYSLRPDRSLSGDRINFRLDEVDDAGTVTAGVHDVTLDLPSSLTSNAGLGLGGSSNGSSSDANLYFGAWSLA